MADKVTYLSRDQILHLAVKRQMQAGGFYDGPLSPQWKVDAQEAWQLFCTRQGFRYSANPDVGIQEPRRAETMEAWIEAEKQVQEAAGFATDRPAPQKSIYAMVKMHTPDSTHLALLDEDMTEAQAARKIETESGLERPDEVLAAEAEMRERMVTDRKQSIQTALRMARMLSKGKVPEGESVTAVAASGPRKVKSTGKLHKADDEALLRTRS